MSRAIIKTVLMSAVAFLAACGHGTSVSGAGHLSQEQIDQRAFALTGGYSGWLHGAKSWERRSVPTGYAAHDGTIVLGDDTRGQSIEWVASVMVHEACHIRGGTKCSTAEEARCIREQVEFDQSIGGSYIKYLKSQIGVHTCGASS